ncbi:unnamed protein product [Tilletia laevis]|uniref:histone deacetylase n=3 Tax=Tilletia TaxID=13289 RepID=A0A9N8LKF0_9BASI|nr:hypothetical protein CF336_g8131 [Tilletia laevis]KAE8246413.1 hypothetical protein A4X03_0g7265 [Tilletia caries]CAD6886348.1 unnamed protein product [Tilletia caries]CAD6924448.1 unnamed protein product [Tilletia laevis]
MPMVPGAASLPASDSRTGADAQVEQILPQAPLPAPEGGPVLTSTTHKTGQARRRGAPYTMTWDGEDVEPATSTKRRMASSPTSSPASRSPAPTVPASYLAQTREYSREFTTGLVYDDRLLLHDIPGPISHPEAPERVEAIYKLLNRSGCTLRMKRIPVREATKEEVLKVHDEGLWNGVEMSAFFPHKKLARRTPLLEAVSSLYVNEYSALCTRLACGGTIELCDAVASRRIKNGFAVVRPPGHHAEPNHSMGFCFYNNVAVAVKTLRERYPDGPNAVKRVLILDWDVHHGNGTQRAFWDDPDTLYVSLHRYENGEYYPGGTYGAIETVGPRDHPAQGTTVNIGWPTIGMGDADYLHAFREVVMPIAREFGPDFVIISAGFDAAEGDQYGECCVTPRGYAHMTHMLSSLAGGRMAVVLEGGYNVQASAAAALEVTKVILGEDPPAYLRGPVAGVVSGDVVREVQKVQSQFWRCMRPSDLMLPLGVDAFADVNGTSRKRPRLFASSSSSAPANPPILTPFYKATGAWRSAHLLQKFGLVRLPMPNLDEGDDDQPGYTPTPFESPADIEACEGSVHVSEDLFERRYNSIVFFVHDAGTVRADPPGVPMMGPDFDDGDRTDIRDFDDIVAEQRAQNSGYAAGIHTMDAPQFDSAGVADASRFDAAARKRYANAHARLKSSREDWSSYLIDATDAMLSWAVYEGRHGVIDVSLPTHISMSLHSGRQRDAYSGPVDPKLSRAGAQYLDRLQARVDALLLYVWDNCVRACPGPSGTQARNISSETMAGSISHSSLLSSSSSSVPGAESGYSRFRISANGGQGSVGPDIVLIGHGPGCEAVLRLITRRALHLSQDLARQEALQVQSLASRPLPVVRAIVQIYGFEDLALVPKDQPTTSTGVLAAPAQGPTVGASPRGHPAAPSMAALAVSAEGTGVMAAPSVAQYASQPGGVGLTIAAQRLGLPTSTTRGALTENGPYINPGSMPVTPGRGIRRPPASPVTEVGSGQGSGEQRAKEREDLLSALRAGPDLQKWYSANSKIILPKDHPYYKWKLEGKIRRGGGDISKRPNETEPLKLQAYAMPGIVSFIKSKIAGEADESRDLNGIRVLAEDSHAHVRMGFETTGGKSVLRGIDTFQDSLASSSISSTPSSAGGARTGNGNWIGAAPPSLPFMESLSTAHGGTTWGSGESSIV